MNTPAAILRVSPFCPVASIAHLSLSEVRNLAIVKFDRVEDFLSPPCCHYSNFSLILTRAGSLCW